MDKFHIEYYFLIKINEKCKKLHRFKLFYKEGKKTLIAGLAVEEREIDNEINIIISTISNNTQP